MDWTIPNADELKGDDFLVDCLKNIIVCGYTMKTKNIDHCQYCKHYEPDEDGFRKKCRERYEKKLEQALKQIGE